MAPDTMADNIGGSCYTTTMASRFLIVYAMFPPQIYKFMELNVIYLPKEDFISFIQVHKSTNKAKSPAGEC